MMRVKVRKLRHWKQRWNKNAQFVWSRRTVFAGVVYMPGDDLPPGLEANKTKLRRFWESNRIELAEFEAPNIITGQKGPKAEAPDSDSLPKGVTVEKGKGSWFVITTRDDQVKVNGQKALDKLLVELRLEADEVDDMNSDADEVDDTNSDADKPESDDDAWLDGKTESE